ncbi:OmpA family protein [Lysobacter firmicutimachus]|uniref:OmpA family protein n=1 Tax=Lysobacter firmicutimachus TaxID=1792846 RepID=A0ABU8CZ86_9GAMM
MHSYATTARRRSLRPLALTAALLLNGASQAQTAAPALTPPAQRIAGAAIHADHRAYAAAQGRIRALNDGGRRVADYHLAKAQCWLDTSFHEYSRNDRGGYPQAALAESIALIEALEGGRDPGFETPLVNGAEKLRADLWARYDALRGQSGFRCAAQATACAEVELVHAGNEIHDGGWRHAKPYIQIAEDLTARAEAAAAACPPPASPERPAPPAESRYDLSADALFAFDRGDLAGLLPRGQGQLDALAAELRGRSDVAGLRIVGHSDRLGSEAYNQRLSQQRAQSVRAYLLAQGVRVPIEAEGRGEREPVSRGCAGERADAALKQCLQPDRRVQIDVRPVRP